MNWIVLQEGTLYHVFWIAINFCISFCQTHANCIQQLDVHVHGSIGKKRKSMSFKLFEGKYRIFDVHLLLHNYVQKQFRSTSIDG